MVESHVYVIRNFSKRHKNYDQITQYLFNNTIVTTSLNRIMHKLLKSIISVVYKIANVGI